MTTPHDSETPAQGQQVITACAFIHHSFDGQEKVFLPKRSSTKKFLPNVFELPGGHLNFGEDIAGGLKREIYEEFGMSIEIGDPFEAFTYINQIKGSHSVEIIFFARFLDPLENIVLDPTDHSEYRWASEREISELGSPAKTDDDPEIMAIRKGFALIKGRPLNL